MKKNEILVEQLLEMFSAGRKTYLDTILHVFEGLVKLRVSCVNIILVGPLN